MVALVISFGRSRLQLREVLPVPSIALWDISDETMVIVFDRPVTVVGLFPMQWIIKMIGFQRVVQSVVNVTDSAILLTTSQGGVIPGINRIDYTSPPVGLVSEMGNPVESFLFTDITIRP